MPDKPTLNLLVVLDNYRSFDEDGVAIVEAIVTDLAIIGPDQLRDAIKKAVTSWALDNIEGMQILVDSHLHFNINHFAAQIADWRPEHEVEPRSLQSYLLGKGIIDLKITHYVSQSSEWRGNTKLFYLGEVKDKKKAELDRVGAEAENGEAENGEAAVGPGEAAPAKPRGRRAKNQEEHRA